MSMMGWAGLFWWCGLSWAAGSPGESYLSQVRRVIDRSRSNLASLTGSAEAAGKEYSGGADGRIWAAGRQADFVDEACGRAGGLMGIGPLGGQTPKRHDIVLYGAPGGLTDGDIKIIEGWRKAGVLVVPFGSSAGVFKKNIPVDTVANVIDLWAWTGEFAAACTRRGKMPVFYQSYGIPGGRERDEKYQGKKFHEDLQVKPVAAGVLGKAYLDKIEAILIRLERTQGSKIVQAGRWWRAAAKNEATTLVIGHMFPRHFLDPRAVQCSDFVSAEAWKDQEMIDAAHPKRFVLYVGYQYAPARLVTQAGAMGVKLVYFDVQPARPAEPATNILYINPGWPLADGCISIPGYDVPILPASGVIDAAIYWAILSDKL